MNILMIGAGYAGLITAVCFANIKNKVYIQDKVKEKLDEIKTGESPFFEKNLSSAISEAVKSNNLIPVFDLSEGFKNAEIIFICVGTPCKKDNSIDLSQLYAVCDELAGLIKESTSRKIIVIRSTVTPGTALMFAERLERLTSKKCPRDFGVVSNPEFLRQGDAIDDFLHHNRVIIGSEHEDDAKKIRELYEPFGRPIFVLSTKAAEMAKYVNNCMSATKISLINEMGLISKNLGVDINELTDAVGLGVGLGNFPLKAGCGFGGGCLEKDVKALIEVARGQNINPRILESALEINDSMVHTITEALERKLSSLEGRKIGVLGLSFKKGTDDTRNSRCIPLIDNLERKKARVSAYDPKAIEKMRSHKPDIDYYEHAQKLIDECDAVVITSDWDEFSKLDYRDKLIIDGRNVVPKEKRGKNYEGICWP